MSSHWRLFFVSVSLLTFTLAQQKWENIYLDIPSAEGARQHLQYLTSFPHVAGTSGDYQSAEYVNNLFRSYGLNSEIQALSVFLNYPISNRLQVVAPIGNQSVASLSEVIYSQDSTSDTWYRNHTFNGYGPSGNVSGRLVYVNYGSVDDFKLLTANFSLNLTGTIAIARYGGIFRGLKAKNAQDNGCVGIIIYSDPADDGFGRGPVYPNGPWRPSSGVQRGSVLFLSLCPGDPTRNPEICGYSTNELIPQIPVLPISYGDAEPLLKAISGPAVPPSWQGGLNFSYHIGPGPAIANVSVQVETVTTPIWNVVATIPGVDPSKEILLGNHRDAWVYGAVDPNSGTSALLELAKGYGTLLQQGWIPGRTIRLLSWDGEEYGLLGSTSFGETFQSDLSAKGIAYLNVDSGVSGSSFGASVTPSLAGFLTDTTKSVIDPNTNQSLYDAWGTTSGGTRSVGRLGSGSDYTVFLDRIGIASADVAFSGSYGVYHSIYDSFYWMSNFGDPTFNYHKLVAQYWGLAGLRLADNRILPFNYVDYATQLQIYYQEVAASAKRKDLTLDFSSLESALSLFSQSAKQIEFLRQSYLSDPDVPAGKVESLNQHLYLAERKFLDSNGLPNRKWFRHVIIAPGLDTGYAASVYPGLAQLINVGDQKGSQQQADLIASLIVTTSQYLAETSSLL